MDLNAPKCLETGGVGTEDRGMEVVRGADVRRLLAVTGSLYEAGQAGRGPFLHAVVEGVARLVPSDVVAYHEIDADGRSVAALATPSTAVPPQAPAVLARHATTHPLIRHYRRTGDPGTRRLSEFVTLRQLRDLGIYSELYGVMGTERQIAFPFPGQGPLSGIAVSRGGRDFDARESTLLELLRPHVIAALHHSRTQAWLRAQPFGIEPDPTLPLTTQEVEVLRQVALGRTNAEIARALTLSARTVQKHLENVYGKVGVRTRAGAVSRVFGGVGFGQRR